MRWTSLLILTLASGVLPSTSLAQPLFSTQRSVEASVANARWVYVGTVDSITRGPGRHFAQQAKFTVQQTIKGPHKASREARLSHPYAFVFAAEADQVPVLVFDFGEREVCNLVPLSDPLSPEVFLASFAVLTDPDKMLAETERIARATVGTVRQQTHRVSVPRENAQGTSYLEYYQTSGHVLLEIPVNAALEARAKKWLDGGEEHPLNRDEAIEILRYFKSEENIALVRKLLKEHLKLSESRPKEAGPSGSVRAARGTLRYWGLQP